ncbi:MAG: hypothetical protein OXK17_00135 [Thaumarchaeota archaeon]|nr:hypothetical protein [Nitrososphaerota archaeon]
MQLGSHVNSESTKNIGFSWRDVIANMRKQKWEIYEPSLSKMNDPAWKLLYDESPTGIKLDESDEKTLVLTLSHADTVRINAEPGSNASKGSQYFWLSKDCYDFFPPLTIRNRRGTKATYSCIIKLNYVDLDGTTDDCRVTFEAENNLDFRLGTGKLRHTRIAKTGDLATIMRIKESQYELRIFKKDSKQYDDLKKYAIHHIGHQGKRYGYISNEEFQDIIRN